MFVFSASFSNALILPESTILCVKPVERDSPAVSSRVPQAERCRLVEQVNGRLKNALLKINCARETEERETSNGDV